MRCSLILSLVLALLAHSVPAGGDELGFDLLEAPKVDPADAQRRADIERMSRRRRLSLQLHQGFGFAMLVATAATLIIGQLSYVDKYGGGDDTGRYNVAHLGLGVGSTALFATTGLLGLFAPTPFPKKLRFDTALIHKIAFGIATAGMVAQMIMGPIVASREGHLDQRDLALGHLISGYVTFGFMATGVIAYVF